MRISDWSSDVCSSDLPRGRGGPRAPPLDRRPRPLGGRPRPRGVGRAPRPAIRRRRPASPQISRLDAPMMNLSEYRTKSARLADFLPWVCLVAEGVVLNKDGSFQRTARFRGPDLDSRTEEQTSELKSLMR